MPLTKTRPLSDSDMLQSSIQWLGDKNAGTFLSHVTPAQPDYSALSAMEHSIGLIEALWDAFEVSSEADRKRIAGIAHAGSDAARAIKVKMNELSALPGSIPWRKNVMERLENVLVRVEDITEVAALSSSKEFIKLLEKKIEKHVGSNLMGDLTNGEPFQNSAHLNNAIPPTSMDLPSGLEELRVVSRCTLQLPG